MRIRQLRWHSYRIPFRTGFTTARGAVSARDGAIVMIEADDGRIGYGDIAPLPTYGGTLEEALDLLHEFSRDCIGSPVAEGLDLFGDMTTPRRYHEHVRASVACGLDLACCDLLAQGQNLSIAAWLAGPLCCTAHVAVNATLGAAGLAEVVPEARRAVQNGFRCLKLKVGTARDLATEVERVAAVRAAIGPDVELRLDANGAWSREDARLLLPQLQPYDIRLIEQPVATLTDLARLRADYPFIPLAADELITSVEQARAAISAGAADVLVVKPVAVGGIRPARTIVRLAEDAGLGVVVTSMLESGVGVVGALQLAATLRQPAWACGLATTALLRSDLLDQPIAVRNGTVCLPAGTGLGVTVSARLLDRYGSEYRRSV